MATQRPSLDLIARTTAAWVCAFNQGGAAARVALGSPAGNPRVSEAVMLPGCGFGECSSDAACTHAQGARHCTSLS